MKTAMTLQTLLEQVKRNTAEKRDFVADTRGAVRMVLAEGFDKGVAVVLLKDGASELERFGITDTAHGQIAEHLGIPFRYYTRLLTDHRDIVIDQVNKLFEREPSMRLLRTLHGRVRAFLSNGYQRIDNNYVLAKTLPAMTSEVQAANYLLSCNVSDERLDIKCVYTDPSLEFDMGPTARTESDIIKPGFHLSNSEVGKGSLWIRSFFYRDYCKNGAVYGGEDVLEFRRAHLGGKLIADSGYEILSDETKKLDDAAIVSMVLDVMKTLCSRKFVTDMATKLRALKQGKKLEQPVLQWEGIAKELDLNEEESAKALENLILDRDYSRWGVLNAVTALAETAPTYERATDLEALSNKVINMPLQTWDRLVRVPEKVAA